MTLGRRRLHSFKSVSQENKFLAKYAPLAQDLKFTGERTATGMVVAHQDTIQDFSRCSDGNLQRTTTIEFDEVSPTTAKSITYRRTNAVPRMACLPPL